MADHFYSVVVGEGTPDLVTKGTSTSGEAIELRVHDGASITKLQVQNALEAIMGYIIRDSAPA